MEVVVEANSISIAHFTQHERAILYVSIWQNKIIKVKLKDKNKYKHNIKKQNNNIQKKKLQTEKRLYANKHFNIQNRLLCAYSLERKWNYEHNIMFGVLNFDICIWKINKTCIAVAEGDGKQTFT